MKILFLLGFCFLSAVAAAQPVNCNALFQNNWTNALLVQYVDENGNAAWVTVPSGRFFLTVIQTDTITGVQLTTAIDPTSYDTNSGSFDVTVNMAGDGSTNDLVVVYETVQSSMGGTPQTYRYGLGAQSYQYMGAIYEHSGLLIANWFPSASECVHMWFYGLCTAICIGLSGASRRLLGRVHEVSTDI